jgi:hypothetical protein
MFWLLVLFALASAQVQWCAGADQPSAVAAAFANFTAVTDASPLPSPKRVDIAAADTAAAFKEKLYLSYDVTVSAELTTAARDEATRRIEALIAAYVALNPLDRGLGRLCAETAAGLFYIQVGVVQAVVDGVIVAVFTAHRDWVTALANLQTALQAKVDAGDTLGILTQQLVIEAQNAVRRDGEIKFYAAMAEQDFRLKASIAVNKTLEYVRKIDEGANVTAATLEEFKQAAITAHAEFYVAYQKWLRALRWVAEWNVEAAAIRARIEAAKERLAAAVKETWDAVKARIQEWFTKAEAYIRERIAAALENFRCDAGAVTATATTNNDGSVTVKYVGIVCYDTTRTVDELRAFACGALKAQFVSEVGTTDVSAYGCVAVAAKKRGLLQTGQPLDVTITGQDPGTPAPSSGVSITACFLLLLFCIIFHL